MVADRRPRNNGTRRKRDASASAPCRAVEAPPRTPARDCGGSWFARPDLSSGQSKGRSDTLLSTTEGRHMTKDRGDLLQGTLDMLVLKALQLEPMHGWGITERIEQWSEHVLQLGQGTLYPA